MALPSRSVTGSWVKFLRGAWPTECLWPYQARSMAVGAVVVSEMVS